MIFRTFAFALTACSLASAAETINITAPGTPFSPGVHGQAAPSINIGRSGYQVGIPKALDVARGSSIRGVFGGLEADISNWETRNNDARPSTLAYLQYARDYNAELIVTANIRGLTAPDPTDSTKKVYTDTSIATVTKLAADWVRYTNHIVPSYRLGQPITDPTDQAILNSLVWNSSFSGDNWNKLLTTTEAAVPKVTYWEIGNEPRVSETAYSVSNSFTFLTPNHTVDSTHMYDYQQRYALMTAAMKAQDPTIKVGPCLQSGSAATERELLDSILKPQTDGSLLPVDFISYHPYQRLGDNTTAAPLTTALKGIYSTQATFVTTLKTAITANGRDPNKIELIASEVNENYFSYVGQPQDARMAHALGVAETAFSFARLGLHAANYWLWPADQTYGTAFPSFKADQGLRDHMGDTILDEYEQNDSKVYTTRNSKTGEIAIWGLNFNDSVDDTVSLSLANYLGASSIKLMRLGALSGKTSLFTSNLTPAMAGGPTNNVDWTTTTLSNSTNLSNYSFLLPSSTISVLLVQPTPEPGSIAIVFVLAGVMLRRRST